MSREIYRVQFENYLSFEKFILSIFKILLKHKNLTSKKFKKKIKFQCYSAQSKIFTNSLTDFISLESLIPSHNWTRINCEIGQE